MLHLCFLCGAKHKHIDGKRKKEDENNHLITSLVYS